MKFESPEVIAQTEFGRASVVDDSFTSCSIVFTEDRIARTLWCKFFVASVCVQTDFFVLIFY